MKRKSEMNSQEDERANKMVKTEEGVPEGQESNGTAAADGAQEGVKAEAEPEEEIELVIEDLFTVYVSARRRNFKLPDEVVQQIKEEFTTSGVTIVDVFSNNPFNFTVRLSSADEVQTLIEKFHKKVVAGIELYVKTKTPKTGQYQVTIKPTNSNVVFDYEYTEEIQEVLKQMDVDVHNCRGIRGQSVEINLYNVEDLSKVMERFNKTNFGFIDIVAESHIESEGGESKDKAPGESTENGDSTKTDAEEGTELAGGDAASTTSDKSQDQENLNCEPFVFAAMKSSSDSFTPKNMKILTKAFEQESISVTRSNTASQGKFAYFFVKSWDEVEKFLSIYCTKLINNMLINFEKGSRKSPYMQQNSTDQQNRYNSPRGGGYSRGGGGYGGGRGGGGGGYNNRGGGGYGGGRGGGGGYYGGQQGGWGGNR